MWYPIKTPGFLRHIYPELVWHKNRKEPTLYLTFDDGPIPDVTSSVLKILRDYKVKATFFCVGENIKRYPDIFNEIREDGHRIGNHTYHHLKGWNTPKEQYIHDIQKCDVLANTNLFRPPYGRATRAQYAILRKSHKIIMWDVLSGDFDRRLSPESCLKKVLKHSKNGSIIVFHDSLKAKERVLYALPRAIEHWLNNGFKFGTL